MYEAIDKYDEECIKNDETKHIEDNDIGDMVLVRLPRDEKLVRGIIINFDLDATTTEMEIFCVDIGATVKKISVVYEIPNNLVEIHPHQVMLIYFENIAEK